MPVKISSARKFSKGVRHAARSLNFRGKRSRVCTACRKPKRERPLSVSAKEKLILEYRANARKLSRSMLRRWHARLDLEEVDSLVVLSLCEAAARYGPNKGASFMTFLYYHLRGCLVRAVDAAANANVVPAADYEIDELSS